MKQRTINSGEGLESRKNPSRTRPGIMLTAMAFIGGLAHNPVLAQDPDRFAEVRETCARMAETTSQINVSSGVHNERIVVHAPLTIELPMQFDDDRYESCLRREGFSTRQRTVAVLDSAADCMGSGVRDAGVRFTKAGNATIRSNVVPAAYRECMARGGPEVDILRFGPAN